MSDEVLARIVRKYLETVRDEGIYVFVGDDFATFDGTVKLTEEEAQVLLNALHEIDS